MLDHTIHIGSTSTFLYFDLYLYSAYGAHYVYGKVLASVAMTIVTFQNGKKLTFNPIYFTNEFSDSNFYFCI